MMSLASELAICLLDGGSAINDAGGVHCDGVSPLMDAAINGHMDIVQLLVERGANIHQKDAKVHVHTHISSCTYMPIL